MQHALIQLVISSVCVTADTTVMVVAVRVRLFRLVHYTCFCNYVYDCVFSASNLISLTTIVRLCAFVVLLLANWITFALYLLSAKVARSGVSKIWSCWREGSRGAASRIWKVSINSELSIYSVNATATEKTLCLNYYYIMTMLLADINECLNGEQHCHTQATCTNSIGSFECMCNTGFKGNGVDCSGEFLKNPIMIYFSWYLVLFCLDKTILVLHLICCSVRFRGHIQIYYQGQVKHVLWSLYFILIFWRHERMHHWKTQLWREYNVFQYNGQLYVFCICTIMVLLWMDIGVSLWVFYLIYYFFLM